jgi:hypothetical protein
MSIQSICSCELVVGGICNYLSKILVGFKSIHDRGRGLLTLSTSVLYMKNQQKGKIGLRPISGLKIPIQPIV